MNKKLLANENILFEKRCSNCFSCTLLLHSRSWRLV